MKAIGILGLVVILGLAWSMSYHRSQVKLRIIGWGLSLQFLFAVIILRQDWWGFAGMSVFASLLIAYIAHAEKPGWQTLLLWLAGGAALALTEVKVLATAVPWLLGALVVFMLVRAQFKLAPRWGRAGAAAFIVSGLAYLISRDLTGASVFRGLSNGIAKFLSMSDYGASFLFGNLANADYYFTPEGSPWPGFGFQFAFKVLPTIIFFGGFMSILYHLGIAQKVIQTLARFLRWTIGTSGAETLSCSANIFVGQTEAPLLIKPFLETMTRSELLTVMVGGFATIAGGVLAAYIAMGVPAGHLVAASVMAAPAALMIGKIIYPETEASQTAGDAALPEMGKSANIIEAATSGLSDGLKLAVNVGAMLLGFIALIAVVDAGLNWIDALIDGRLLGGAYTAYKATGFTPAVGEYVGWFPGSLQTVFGVVLRPLAFVMGVPWEEAALVGNLLGIKLSLNELVSYSTLSGYISSGTLSERATIIATYALCGFANFSSIGIQIGGISAIAPSRRKDLSMIGLRAMFGGALVSCLTATIAGLLL